MTLRAGRELTFGVLGAGRVGSNFALLALGNGHRVVLANSRDPATLAELVARLGPNALAATPAAAVDRADVLLLATPFHALGGLPVDQMRGKVTIDATTYYPRRDGVIAVVEERATTPGEYVQARLAGVPIVRALTHVTAADLPRDGSPAGAPNRRAFALTGEVAEAKGVVAGIFDAFGYDTVDFGSLSESWRYDPFTPVSGVRVTADELRDMVAAAQR